MPLTGICRSHRRRGRIRRVPLRQRRVRRLRQLQRVSSIVSSEAEPESNTHGVLLHPASSARTTSRSRSALALAAPAWIRPRTTTAATTWPSQTQARASTARSTRPWSSILASTRLAPLVRGFALLVPSPASLISCGVRSDLQPVLKVFALADGKLPVLRVEGAALRVRAAAVPYERG